MNTNMSDRDVIRFNNITHDILNIQDPKEYASKPYLIESLIRELDFIDTTYGSDFAKIYINNRQNESIFTANNILAEQEEYRKSASFNSQVYKEKFGALTEGPENTDFALRDDKGNFKPLDRTFFVKLVENVKSKFPKLQGIRPSQTQDPIKPHSAISELNKKPKMKKTL